MVRERPLRCASDSPLHPQLPEMDASLVPSAPPEIRMRLTNAGRAVFLLIHVL